MALQQLSRLPLTWFFQVIRHRRFFALVSLVFLFALAVQGANAGTSWCRSDPVVGIESRPADIFVRALLEAPLLVTGPTHIVISVPPGIDTMLIASDLGFGQGEIVEFSESASLKATAERIDVRIRVYVPATDDSMPVLVEFTPEVVGVLAPASAQGTANTWVSLKTWI
ncbi:MAG: hypothetical protein M3R02_20650 [Chloroflexota bacterium]|nr:hypothetical protein [Chloroflexota bacterium]